MSLSNAMSNEKRAIGPLRRRRAPGVMAAALALVAAGLMLAPVPRAAAQESDVEAAVVRASQAYGPEVAERVASVLERAGSRQIPAAPLVNKVFEGAAKGVPGEALVAGLSAFGDRLSTARQALGQGASSGEVVAAAGALQRGASPEAVGELASLASGDGAIPLIVLGDLVEAGVPVDRALAVVEQALERGHRGQGLLRVSSAVRGLVASGRPPGEAVQAVERAMQQGKPPAEFPGVGKGAPGGIPGMGPSGAVPVPPGAGPPDHAAGKGKGKGKGKGGS